jgi:hypothetical protein
VPGGQQHRQRFAALLAGQVQFGGPPATGPAQSVIARLGTDVTRGFDLMVREPPSARSVLMGPSDGGIDADIPGDHSGRVRTGLQAGDDLLPYPSRYERRNNA